MEYRTLYSVYPTCLFWIDHKKNRMNVTSAQRSRTTGVTPHYSHCVLSWLVYLLFGVGFIRWLIYVNSMLLFINAHFCVCSWYYEPRLSTSNRTYLNFNRSKLNQIFWFERRNLNRNWLQVLQWQWILTLYIYWKFW